MSYLTATACLPTDHTRERVRTHVLITPHVNGIRMYRIASHVQPAMHTYKARLPFLTRLSAMPNSKQ
eukprot:2098169-Pleurochrysis_carterae.AAC.1